MRFVYAILNARGTVYVGQTTDVERRLAQHNGEKPGGAKFTRGRGPWRIVHVEAFAAVGDALRRERALKRDRKFKATLRG
ncbi:MAG: GIY-YIG nuclease family protein [Rhodospirillales bacterium]|nr:GIY-YIG nuclease family protein [Rhodospirillales bacterium]